MIDPRNGDTGIFGRTEKPRTGSEALLLRESTAPNANRIAALEDVFKVDADRIAELERKVENLRVFVNYLERRMGDDREQVRKLKQEDITNLGYELGLKLGLLKARTDNLEPMLQTLADAIATMWLDS